MNDDQILKCKELIFECISLEEQKASEIQLIDEKYRCITTNTRIRRSKLASDIIQMVINYKKISAQAEDSCPSCAKSEYENWLNDYDLKVKKDGVECHKDADHPNDRHTITISWKELIEMNRSLAGIIPVVFMLV